MYLARLGHPPTTAHTAASLPHAERLSFGAVSPLVHSKYVAVTTSLLARPYGQQGHPRMRISQELFKQKLSNKFLSLTIFTQNMWKILLNSLELVFIEYFQF